MTIEAFDRTWEQNEDLGLNDMKVEGYEAPEPSEGKGRSKGEEEEEKKFVDSHA